MSNNLYVAEFTRLATAGGLTVQAPEFPPIAEQKVTFTTSTPSGAFNGETRILRLNADADCHVNVGAAPVATAAMYFLKAGVEYFIGVNGGNKIAVYDGVS